MLNIYYCVIIFIILVILYYCSTKELFQQDFYFNYNPPQITSMNFDTYPHYPYTSYFGKVKPTEILSTPIIWYNNRWFSNNFGITSGAGAYSIVNDYGNRPGIIGQASIDCLSNIYV